MKTKVIVLILLIVFIIAFAVRASARGNNGSMPGPHNSRLMSLNHNMHGIKKSLYVGKWYDQRTEPIRRCIVRRESNGYYRVENRSSSAAGAYQMLIGTSNYVARKMHRRDLVGVPASHWSRWEQDKGFYRLWAHGKGKGHWAGGNFSCF